MFGLSAIGTQLKASSRRTHMPINAITFDVGGTLVKPWPSVGHVYAQVAAQSGAGQFDPALLTSRFIKAWKALPNFDYSVAGWASIVDETFAGLTTDKPSRTFFPTLYERFAAAEAWHLYDDVLPLLQKLAERRIRLGIISNWDARLRPLLTALGLAQYFEVITISCEVGATKPSPQIFQAAANAFSLPPQRILHIGDSLAADVHGAQAVGFHSLLIDRDRAAGQGVIRSLLELLEVPQLGLVE